MNHRDRVQLLFGPYKPPPLKRGDRTTCLVRDCDVVITSWTEARISWPRCQPLHTRGGNGILVDETLAWAIRHESAAAIGYWWGIGVKTVAWWRKTLGVGRADSEGSRRLILTACRAGAQALKRNGLPDKVCDKMSERAKRQHQIRFLQQAPPPRPLWTRAQLRLLGKAPDAEIAARIGRTVKAVRVMRTRLGIPTAQDRRRKRRPWSVAEDRLLGKMVDTAVAQRTGRTVADVWCRRRALRIGCHG